MYSINDFTICKRCLMDSKEVDFQINENGFCNYCSDYLDSRLNKQSLRQHSSEDIKNMIVL
jgi:recombinational DNA repair protein (RecF pathway)